MMTTTETEAAKARELIELNDALRRAVLAVSDHVRRDGYSVSDSFRDGTIYKDIKAQVEILLTAVTEIHKLAVVRSFDKARQAETENAARAKRLADQAAHTYAHSIHTTHTVRCQCDGLGVVPGLNGQVLACPGM